MRSVRKKHSQFSLRAQQWQTTLQATDFFARRAWNLNASTRDIGSQPRCPHPLGCYWLPTTLAAAEGSAKPPAVGSFPGRAEFAATNN